MTPYRVVRMIGILAAALVFAAVLLEYRAGRELKTARLALDQNQTEIAVVHYSRCMDWYVPFGSAGDAAEDLLRLAVDALEQGRDDLAWTTLWRARSGLFGARSLWTPRPDLIEQYNTLLSELMAERRLGPDAAATDLEAKEKEYLGLLSRPSRPAVLSGLAASGGFYIWVGGMIAFIFAWFDPQGRRRNRLYARSAFALIGLVLWQWGMIVA